MRLLEVFKDFIPTLNGASQFGRYKAQYRLIPKRNTKPLTPGKLYAYVDNLKKRYPKNNFRLEHIITVNHQLLEKIRSQIEYLERRARGYPGLSVMDRAYLQHLKSLPLEYFLKHLYVINQDGNPDIKAWHKGRVPIYFDLQARKVYVEAEIAEKEPRLVSYILMRTLGALGLTTVKHEKIIGRRE